MADLFEDLIRGINAVQSDDVNGGLKDIAGVLETVLTLDVGDFREGLTLPGHFQVG